MLLTPDKREVPVEPALGEGLQLVGGGALEAKAHSSRRRMEVARLAGGDIVRVAGDVSDNSRVGLLDFRPEKKGPFGRFVVTSWK